MQTIKTDLCVIGAGSGGLSVAAGAVQMGASVVLIESDKMGGDCLNTGCVPSKATIAAAKKVYSANHLSELNKQTNAVKINYEKLAQYVKNVIAQIAPNDSVERFEDLGVKVIQAVGQFIDSKTIQAGDKLIKARRFVIATGSSAAIPPIPGLLNCHFYTNETIFKLTEEPEHLIVIGGGPIGCELSQAHLMMGTKVTLLEGNVILPKDDPEAVHVVRKNLLQQGLGLHEGIKIINVKQAGAKIAVTIENNGQQQDISGSHLLVAAGRKPNLSELNLSKAQVKHTPGGIDVDARLRTSNKKIFAIGDAAGSFQFTHTAGYHAGIVIRNALFHLPAKVNYTAIPWVTYTTPELAQVGPNEPMLKQQGEYYQAITWPFSENDRAIAQNDTAGFIKLLLNKKGVIIGATIVGPNAGELITTYVLAVSKKLKIGDIANLIIPYPTLSEVGKRAAGKYYLPSLTSKKVKRIVKFLQKF